jgi:hypothetical protein
VCGDAANEEASRIFANGDWTTQEPWPALNAGAVLTSDKFAFDIVVADAPTPAIDFGADSAEGVEEFEQANVIVVRSLHDGQEVVGRNGVDGETLLRSGAQKK